ncbi:hypothetical protein [Haloferula sp. BvORR071]|uniref:hypothetical protein n=1 Tax=Haloferula sp. BvORR071 TaxID=1396141 RepID=UPI000698CB1C|nr:hypothetical protein [Haloferula sp. BvORR071]
MKKHLPGLRVAGAAVLVALCASSIGCYSAAYPRSYQSAPAYTDAKGYQVPGPEQPAPPQAPPYGYGYRSGVDPGLAIAGVAAAGLLGYALGHNHHSYYGPGYYYGPVPYRYGYGYRGHYGRYGCY